MTNNIKYEKDGHIRIITINRHNKMNSLDADSNKEIIEAWTEFNSDSDARVAVITGAGDEAFCTGADLKTYSLQFATVAAPKFRRDYTNGPGFAGITRNLDIWKPKIAAVNGYAISGGLELSLACDIRFCSPNAEFGLQDVKWGFHACDGGLVRLPRIVGLGHALEIILSGERINAEHAYRIGLVNRIYDQDILFDESLKYAHMLAKRGPLAQQFANEVVSRTAGMPLDEALRLESRSLADLGHTEDMAEGNKSFQERRPANFVGR